VDGRHKRPYTIRGTERFATSVGRRGGARLETAAPGKKEDVHEAIGRLVGGQPEPVAVVEERERHERIPGHFGLGGRPVARERQFVERPVIVTQGTGPLRSKTSATGGNMDSMLDTLTNVVGILVIVLVAVQLSSQEAAIRIAEAVAKIDPAEIERRKAEAEAASKAREEALRALEEERGKSKQDPAELLEKLRKQLAQAEEDSEAEARKAEELEKKAAEAIEAAKAAEEKLAAELKALEEQSRRDTVRLDALRVEVEAARKIDAPPVKEVRLPNPRPLPTRPDGKPLKMEPVIVLCRGGRGLPIVDSLIRAKSEKRLGELVKARKLDSDKDNWLEDAEGADAIIKLFNEKPPADRDFTLSIEVIQQRIFITLTPKPDGGETPDEAAKGDFAEALTKTKPASIYFLYRVEPDCFEPYLQLRLMTDRAGFVAGWDPIDPNSIHKVATKYMVGKKPPPPPPPDPNAPKPPPPPPPKPPIVLD
jgi:hypothetical protein